jgi:hypothetical protein
MKSLVPERRWVCWMKTGQIVYSCAARSIWMSSWAVLFGFLQAFLGFIQWAAQAMLAGCATSCRSLGLVV